MRKFLQSAAILVFLVFGSGLAAHAANIQLSDTYTGPNGFVASWTMLQNPVVLSSTAFSFDAQVSNFLVNGVSVTNDSVDFFGVAPFLQGLFDDNMAYFGGAVPGTPLFSGSFSSPTMSIGTFSLIGFGNLSALADFTLTVTPATVVSTPEPSVALLLGLGLWIRDADGERESQGIADAREISLSTRSKKQKITGTRRGACPFCFSSGNLYDREHRRTCALTGESGGFGFWEASVLEFRLPSGAADTNELNYTNAKEWQSGPARQRAG